MKFDQQVALVTGGGSGIGRAIASALSMEGARICICGRSPEKLDRCLEEINADGAIAIPADLSDPDQVARLVSEIESRLGPVDILVNNAGVARFAPLHELPLADFDRMMQVNVRGALICCQAVLPSMIERRHGRILSISSASSLRPYPQQGGYCASKHALNGLMKVLALEMQEFGIRVQVLSPGGVDTDLARGIRDDVDFGEWMRPEDVAEAALFLLAQDGLAHTDHLILRRNAAPPWANASG